MVLTFAVQVVIVLTFTVPAEMVLAFAVPLEMVLMFALGRGSENTHSFGFFPCNSGNFQTIFMKLYDFVIQ